MDIEPVGHIIVFGDSYSGKTYFTKHFIKSLNPKKVFAFAGEQYQWDQPEYDVQKDDFETSANKIITECSQHMTNLREEAKNNNQELEASTPFVLVFDDFNEEINTKSNELYKQLYTRGRHHGIRIINIAHHSKAIGPAARANAKYIFMMCSMADDEIKAIADMFFGKDHLRLMSAAKKALSESKYNVLMIDRVKKTIHIDKAPDKSLMLKQSDDIIPVIPRHQSLEVVPNDMATISQMPGDIHYNRIGGGMQLGNKSAQYMYDNSKNQFNVDYTIKNEQKITSNHTNNKIKFENIKVENTINLYQNMHDVADIVRKPWHSPEEIKKIVYVLNRTLRADPPYTIHDYKEGIRPFLKQYFNDDTYSTKKSTVATISEAAGNIYLAQSDPVMLLSSIAGFYNQAKNNYK